MECRMRLIEYVAVYIYITSLYSYSLLLTSSIIVIGTYLRILHKSHIHLRSLYGYSGKDSLILIHQQVFKVM